MDVQRTGAARRRLIRRIVLGGVALAVVVGVSLGLSRLKPAAPEVERSVVWLDTVKRGPMVREVRGLGSLVPEQILWIPAASDGRVEKTPMLAGAVVKADTVLVVLSNPELELAALDAEYAVKGAEARLQGLAGATREPAPDPGGGSGQAPVRLPPGEAAGGPGQPNGRGGVDGRAGPADLGGGRRTVGQPPAGGKETPRYVRRARRMRSWRCREPTSTSCARWPS